METHAAVPRAGGGSCSPGHGSRCGGVDDNTPAGAEEDDGDTVTEREELGPQERLVRVPEEDNGAFFAKIKQMMDRCDDLRTPQKDDLGCTILSLRCTQRAPLFFESTSILVQFSLVS
ncbi:hypothetical protein ACP70R_037213 [Stipagrostis hirtigluma subsp. patula]